jgi:hypothetical protein
MKLSEFVSETIKELIDGVNAARKYAEDKDALVNPLSAYGSGNPYSAKNGRATFVEFDVVVTTTDTDKGKGGVGIFVGAFGVGVQGEEATENSSVSRVKFTIPVMLPLTQN